MRIKKQSLLAVSAVLIFGMTVIVLPMFQTGAAAGSATKQRDERVLQEILLNPGFENYDIRTDGRLEQTTTTIASVGQTAKRAREDSAVGTASLRASAAVRQAMVKAEARLAQRVPDLEIKRSDRTHLPEIVQVKKGADGSLASPAFGQGNENVLRNFIADNAALYGLRSSQMSQLRTTADYSNPAGNLSWVNLEQRINGIPVFQGQLTAAFTRNKDLVRTVSYLVPALEQNALNTTPAISAAEAVAAAAGSIDVAIKPADLVQRSGPGGNTVKFEPGPFAEEIKVELTYFPTDPEHPTLAWSMVLWQDIPAYWAVVDAESGELLWRKNITDTQTQSVTYSIYNDDSPGPLSPSNALPGSGIQGPGIARATLTLVSELPAFDNLGWITDGGNTTTGNNVDAGLDLVAPNGIDPGTRPIGSPFRVFDFPYNPPPLGADVPTGADYRNGIVTNLFFWTNRYHDRLYELGFTEAARNFQQDNFGRGGLGNDFVRAEAQDSSGTNNANFATPADGSLPRMQMFIFTGPTPDRDGDIDADVFLHEMTHGTSNRLHANASGLTGTQAGGMGEGWSDFYARSLLSTADEDVNGIYAAGAYVTPFIAAGFTDNFYYGIRRFPYAVKTTVGANGKPHNPLTFADIDPAQINVTDGAFPRGPIGSANAAEVHNIGEIWCMTLLEMRARIITRLGFATGNQRALQIVTDGMKLDPVGPNLLDARNSILAADCAGFGGADEVDIWQGFATRGMGFGAKVNGATSVTEAFDMPNLTLGNVTFSDSGSCNPGFADPNESLVFTVPLNNPFCSMAATGVTASVAGGGSATYGTIGGGSTASMSIPFTVPAGAACGDLLTITVNINSSLGAVARTFSLRVGKPIIAFSENFDGVAAPSLPAGWSATNVSGPAPLWVTTATTPDTSPNAAFVNDPNVVSDKQLDSPSFSIATGAAQLTFRNSYNLQANSDGGVLEISIGGGPFADIIASGGAFVGGGYNSTIASGTSPIVGRQAWSGNSNGYLTTTVNLPASAAGNSVVLRWRMASNAATAGTGWRVDTISVVDGYICCCVITCPANITTSNTTGVCGTVVTYPDPVAGSACGAVTCAPPSGSFFPVGTTTVTCNTTSGTNCSFTATVNDTEAPTIVCPANITAVTNTVSDACKIVTFAPTASDNCSASVICTPASGSCFAVGLTTVNCTATDPAGNKASCGFTVTVFNGRLQDDSEGCNNIVVFNTLTGAYRYCCHGTVYTGIAHVTGTAGNFALEHNAPDRRVLIKLAGAFPPSGTASVSSPPGVMKCTLQDRDTRNNTCICQ